MTKKAWIIFSLLCIGLVAGMIWLGRSDQTNVSDVDHNAVQAAEARNGNIADHTYGKTGSKVLVIAYGDFQCPGCASAAPVFAQVKETYKDKVLFVFRNKPLTSIHPNALASSAAVEAAGLQGKYWEMHDVMYSTQDSWKDLAGEDRTNFFVARANEIGIDGDKLKADLELPEIRKKINFDSALADKAGVTGTPTFYINGKEIKDVFIDGKLVPAGTKDARQVWTDAEAFGKLIIDPALKETGIQ